MLQVSLRCHSASAPPWRRHNIIPICLKAPARLSVSVSARPFSRTARLTQFSTPGVAPTGPVPSKVDYDTGLAFDAAFGWAFNRYVALDFETGFIGAEINNVPGYLSDNSRIYNVPFLVNATLSYPIPRTNIIPYVGAGVGGADMVFDTDNFRITPA